MAHEELPWEERDQLYKMSAMVTVGGFLVFLVYFIYLMQHALIKTTQDFLVIFLLPLMIFPISAGVLLFEILYHRRIKKPLKFHLRRAGLTLSLVLASAVSLVAFLMLIDIFLSPVLGGRAILLGFVLWTLIFAAVILKFRAFLKNLQ